MTSRLHCSLDTSIPRRCTVLGQRCGKMALLLSEVRIISSRISMAVHISVLLAVQMLVPPKLLPIPCSVASAQHGRHLPMPFMDRWRSQLPALHKCCSQAQVDSRRSRWVVHLLQRRAADLLMHSEKALRLPSTTQLLKNQHR